MIKVQDRFIKYVKIDTQSDPRSNTSPTTMKQKNLGKILVEELHEIGVSNAYLDDYGYVYAKLDGNCDAKEIGFIAHMDTAPDYTGKDVKPRIIENYDGKDIELSEDVILKIAEFPEMPNLVGKDIIVTDGHTLLGADDKAGIAEIMAMVEHLVTNPDVKHGLIHICFTPDEEVGKGTANFNLKQFTAEFAYTVDGGSVDCIDYENFNAASAEIEIEGVSIHPGSAKDKMINAANIAIEYINLLPVHKRPEHTEGYDGFYHLGNITGNLNTASIEYIIRNHDEKLFAQQKQLLLDCAEFINKKYNKELVKISIKDTYANMKKHFEDKMYIIDIAQEAIKEVGLTPRNIAIRGGTDGAMLTYMGIPCPNLGTGGGNVHGRYEYCCIQEMELAVKILLSIVRRVAHEK